MLDSAFDYIDGEEMVAKIDAMIDTIDEERAAKLIMSAREEWLED